VLYLESTYKFKWTEKTVPATEDSSDTTTEGYMENYKNVSQDIRNQLDVEAEAVQIILTGIDNDIYSTVDAYLETNLYWEFGKCTSRDGESLKFYYSRFYKMMNDLVRNQCDVTNHQVNVQVLLQLQPKWKRFVTLVKQSQELKTVSYHKLYDILKQHQNEVNEIRAERLACTANPLALVAQQQPVYHPQNHPNHYTQNSSTRSQQAATRNKGKAIKIYKPTNNNLKTSSNTSRAHQDNAPRINQGTGYDNLRVVNVARARENVEVTLDVAENSGPIFDDEPLQKVQNNDDNYNVFANDREHHEQPESVNVTYLKEHGDTNITTDLLDMSNNEGEADQDEDDDLAREHDLLASLIEKLKCEINESKNRNKLLESSNKTLVDKLKSEIEDFKTKNKSLESSNNHFKEENKKRFDIFMAN
ncbi:hypothetical protein Tco_1245419, partial [Tanacetum coccineum]